MELEQCPGSSPGILLLLGEARATPGALLFGAQLGSLGLLGGRLGSSPDILLLRGEAGATPRALLSHRLCHRFLDRLAVLGVRALKDRCPLVLSQGELSLKGLIHRLDDPVLVDVAPSEVIHLDRERVLQRGPAHGSAIGLGTRLFQLVFAEDAVGNQPGNEFVDALQRLAAHELGAQLLKHDQRVAVDVVVGVSLGRGVVDLEDATGTHIARNE